MASKKKSYPCRCTKTGTTKTCQMCYGKGTLNQNALLASLTENELLRLIRESKDVDLVVAAAEMLEEHR